MLLSPALAIRCGLTQPELTTIVLAGMIGQYPFSAFVGKIIDHRGPATCSAVASVLFAGAYGLFAHEISKVHETKDPYAFYRLTLYFFLAGLGTVFSYFSTVFAASRVLPNHSGVAAGISMSLFGLSPLFLSTIASNVYMTEFGLDIIPFLKFMTVFSFITHVNGALNIRVSSHSQLQNQPIEPPRHPDTRGGSCSDDPADEHTALLPTDSTVDFSPAVVLQDNTMLSVFKDWHFWFLATSLFFTLGMCEMVLSNIGSIAMSLPPSHGHFVDTPLDAGPARQVKLLSLANTLSRIVVGPLADFVSPVVAFLPPDGSTIPRRHYISRISFLTAASLLLAATFLVVSLTVRSQGQLWILSVGCGISYGAIFTVLPSIISAIWGVTNLGRNFGALTYAPFLGTPVFSYLYAFIYARDAESSSGICYGSVCWITTFWFCFVTAVISFIGTLILWRNWRGRL
ncbi:hypothetical protein HGRIS_013175 [Hohenbuehelia grisea]|uniref:NFD4 C-terminal domain-containing protein n=1 Tax=Hohenbuehelia grisea TaxID=104357 RepID=A0ABR3IUR7_9AGAR